MSASVLWGRESAVVAVAASCFVRPVSRLPSADCLLTNRKIINSLQHWSPRGSWMIHAKESNLIVIKLDDGELLHSGLERALGENMVKSGVVLGGVGMITDFKIGYFDGKEYVAKEVKEPHELLSLQGNIAHAGGGQLMLHLHCTVGSKEHDVIGGHLLSAKVMNMAEIFVMRFVDLELGRRRNERTGLMEMEIHKTSDPRFGHTAAKHRSGSLELDID